MTSKNRLFKKIHPLFFITISLMFGISWQILTHPFNVSNFLYYAALIISINALIITYFTQKYLFILPLLCITSFVTGILLSDYQCKKHYYIKNILCEKKFDAQGIIKNISIQPYLRTPYRITFKILNITQDHNLNANIYIYTQPIKNIRVGDKLLLKNIVCNNINNNSFEQYLIKENVYGTLFCNNLDFEIIHRPIFSLNRWLNIKKENILQSFQKKLSCKTFPLFSSLFLGNKTSCKKELEPISDTFKTWGISHYLARSGLHLIVFALLLELILRIIPVTFWIKQLIMLLFSLLYFLFSWTTISFMRALYTFILYKFCIIFKKQSHFIHLLTIICFITLLVNPIQLLFLDFQLSFTLTFALAYFNHMYRTQDHLKT